MTGRKGHFGPAVIGEEAFAQEQADVAKGIDYFGPSVVGDSQPQQPTPQQLKDQPGLAALHGIELAPAPQRVVEGVKVELPNGTVPIVAPAAAQDNAQLSLEKLKEALDNAFSTDAYIEAEFARVEGPRKGALRLLIEKERANVRHDVDGDVVARPEVLARLETALKPGVPA